METGQAIGLGPFIRLIGVVGESWKREVGSGQSTASDRSLADFDPCSLKALTKVN